MKFSRRLSLPRSLCQNLALQPSGSHGSAGYGYASLLTTRHAILSAADHVPKPRWLGSEARRTNFAAASLRLASERFSATTCILPKARTR